MKAFATTALPPKVGRSIVLIPLAKADPEVCKGLIQRKSGIAGVLLLLPASLDKGELSAEESDNLEALEALLLSGPLEVPVFFAFESDSTNQLVLGVDKFVASGLQPSAANGGYELVIAGAPSKPMSKPPQGINYNAYIQGTEADPVLLITANYDTFSAVPGLARGADGNGSGVTLLLQLMKIMRRLYGQTEASRGRLNIMFLLTSAGSLNFDSTTRWMSDQKEDFISRIQFTLCLHSLGTWAPAAGLHLHYSKPPKEALVAQWYGALRQAAQLHGVPLTEAHRKVNLSAPQVAWEHEHFSKSKILAATLSGRPTPPATLARSTLADVAARLNLTALTLATRVVAEAVARMAYPKLQPPTPIISSGGPLDVDPLFLAQWTRLLASEPRVLSYWSHDTSRLHPALHSVFQSVSDEGATRIRQLWTPPRGLLSAHNCSAPLRLHVHKTASIMFDAVFLLSNILYLAALFAGLRVGTRGWGDLVAMFKTSSPNKYKK